MKRAQAYSKVKVTDSPVECTYDNGSASGIVTVAWSPAGGGLLDDLTEADKTVVPSAIDIGGRRGRTANGDVQVVVDGAAIDVFGIDKTDTSEEAALAAAFAARV